MADDDRPLIDPRLFAPAELLGDDMDHTVDVSGATQVDVEHALDLDVPTRRIELGLVAFSLLVVLFGVVTAAAPTVQVSAAAAVVLVGDLLVGSGDGS